MRSARRVLWCSLWLLSVSAVVSMAGCGGSGLVPVTGTVTLDGTPLEGAAVNFTPATAGQGQPAQGETDASGKFTLSTVGGAGAIAGSYKVGVSKMEAPSSDGGLTGDAAKSAAGGAPAGTQLSGPPAPGGSGGRPKEAPPKYLVPVKYINPDTSGVTVEVKSGMAPVTIELKSS